MDIGRRIIHYQLGAILPGVSAPRFGVVPLVSRLWSYETGQALPVVGAEWTEAALW